MTAEPSSSFHCAPAHKAAEFISARADPAPHGPTGLLTGGRGSAGADSSPHGRTQTDSAPLGRTQTDSAPHGRTRLRTGRLSLGRSVRVPSRVLTGRWGQQHSGWSQRRTSTHRHSFYSRHCPNEKRYQRVCEANLKMQNDLFPRVLL